VLSSIEPPGWSIRERSWLLGPAQQVCRQDSEASLAASLEGRAVRPALYPHFLLPPHPPLNIS
jgi:hypothetical protein